jgi:hypothetical protein
MIFDAENLCFNDEAFMRPNGQKVSTDPATPDVIDLGVDGRNIGVGMPVPVAVVMTDPAGASGADFDVETSANENFSAGANTKTILTISIPQNEHKSGILYLPHGLVWRYLRITGKTGATSGKCIGGIVGGHQHNPNP